MLQKIKVLLMSCVFSLVSQNYAVGDVVKTTGSEIINSHSKMKITDVNSVDSLKEYFKERGISDSMIYGSFIIPGGIPLLGLMTMFSGSSNLEVNEDLLKDEQIFEFSLNEIDGMRVFKLLPEQKKWKVDVEFDQDLDILDFSEDQESKYIQLDNNLCILHESQLSSGEYIPTAHFKKDRELAIKILRSPCRN
jgi:hypothetical protein